MKRTLARLASVAAVSTAVVATTAGASYALGEVRYWNSSSAPLTVTGYGSSGYGYGTWKVSTGTDGTRSRLTANLRINNADNHAVYATLTTQTNAGYCVEPDYTSCTAQYFTYATQDTAHYTGASWKALTTSTGLNASGNYARGLVNVKLDIPWRTDPSSGTTFTRASAY